MCGVKRKIILTKDYFDPEKEVFLAIMERTIAALSAEIIDSDELPIT